MAGEQWSQEASDSARRFSVDASGGTGLPLHLQGSPLLPNPNMHGPCPVRCIYILPTFPLFDMAPRVLSTACMWHCQSAGVCSSGPTGLCAMA